MELEQKLCLLPTFQQAQFKQTWFPRRGTRCWYVTFHAVVTIFTELRNLADVLQ